MSTIFKVLALYSYAGGEDSDLSFSKDQLINVTNIANSEWYFGEYTDKETNQLKSGMFPKNYVEKIDAAETTAPEIPKKPVENDKNTVLSGSHSNEADIDVVSGAESHAVDSVDAVSGAESHAKSHSVSGAESHVVSSSGDLNQFAPEMSVRERIALMLKQQQEETESSERSAVKPAAKKPAPSVSVPISVPLSADQVTENEGKEALESLDSEEPQQEENGQSAEETAAAQKQSLVERMARLSGAGRKGAGFNPFGTQFQFSQHKEVPEPVHETAEENDTTSYAPQMQFNIMTGEVMDMKDFKSKVLKKTETSVSDENKMEPESLSYDMGVSENESYEEIERTTTLEKLSFPEDNMYPAVPTASDDSTAPLSPQDETDLATVTNQAAELAGNSDEVDENKTELPGNSDEVAEINVDSAEKTEQTQESLPEQQHDDVRESSAQEPAVAQTSEPENLDVPSPSDFLPAETDDVEEAVSAGATPSSPHVDRDQPIVSPLERGPPPLPTAISPVDRAPPPVPTQPSNAQKSAPPPLPTSISPVSRAPPPIPTAIPHLEKAAPPVPRHIDVPTSYSGNQQEAPILTAKKAPPIPGIYPVVNAAERFEVPKTAAPELAPPPLPTSRPRTLQNAETSDELTPLNSKIEIDFTNFFTWANTLTIPESAFQTNGTLGKYIVERDVTESVLRDGKSKITVFHYYVLFENYSQIVASVVIKNGNAAVLAVDQDYYTTNLDDGKVETLPDANGLVLEAALKNIGSNLAYTSSIKWISEIYKNEKIAPVIANRTFGYNIFRYQPGSSDLTFSIPIKPGDVLAIRNGNFSQEPLESMVIVEFNSEELTFSCVSLSQEGEIVREFRRLGDMTKGKLRVFRPVSRSFINW